MKLVLYIFPWHWLYSLLRLGYPLHHPACRWVFAMWARACADEWPRDVPWWGGYNFDPDEPSYWWPRLEKS
jgi:hypothetical protein